VKLLLDTHILIWAALEDVGRLSLAAQSMIMDPTNSLWFSAASIWEIAVKSGLKRADFDIDPELLRRASLENGYGEIAITGQHATAVRSLASLHKDPFDRLLLAQAHVEGMLLLTADGTVARYGRPAHLV
jgi:PIN domain nuclease of toxin-antitoxin system